MARRRPFRLGLFMAVMATLLWTVLPFYWMVATSLTQQRELIRFPAILIPSTPTLERFRIIFWGGESPLAGIDVGEVAAGFRQGLLNSAMIAAITCIIALVIGGLAGYAFARLRFRFRRPMLLVAISMQMLPPIATVIPLYFMLRNFGLLNSRTGLIIVYCAHATVYVLWVMNGYYRSIPSSLDEAARVDGCSRFGNRSKTPGERAF